LENHPIEELMKTAMESIKGMVEVNTIVGDPVEAPDGHVIIPISRVSFGFAAGGSEFEKEQSFQSKQPNENQSDSLPFGGGSGAGVSVQPVAFLVVGNGQVRLLTVDNYPLVDRVLDMAPQIIDNLQKMTDQSGDQAQGNGKTEYEYSQQPSG